MSEDNNFVYRYLKTSDIKTTIKWADVDSAVHVEQASSSDFISESTFEINRPDQDVSFFRSFKDEDANRILDVLSELYHRRNGIGFSVNSGMMRIDFEIAHEDLNDIRETIRFVDNDKTKRECRHYGLYILTTSALDRLETVNALIEHADFYALKQKNKAPDTRDFLAFIEGGEFFKIAEDIPIAITKASDHQGA